MIPDDEPALITAIIETLHDGRAMTKIEIIKTAKVSHNGRYRLAELKACVDLLIDDHILVVEKTEHKRSADGNYDIHYWKAIYST